MGSSWFSKGCASLKIKQLRKGELFIE